MWEEVRMLNVGIDIAQATFVAALWLAGRGQLLGTFPNTPAGFAQLVAALQTYGAGQAVHLVLEPTGGYELALAHFALQQGWQVSLPNPKQVRDYLRGRGRRGKNDPLDAKGLAQYGAETDPPAWQPLPAELAELESLQRRKDDLEQMLRQERNRQHALAQRPQQHAAVPQSVERIIEALESELAAVERAIADQLKRYAPLQAAVKRLRTVPGVGAKTVVPLLVLLARWETLTDGQGDAKGLTAYVGLDPQDDKSGTSVYKPATISRMGDKVLRRKLFMGALGGVRGKNVLRGFYQRLVGRGKKKKLALVAAARKLLVWAWKVYQTRTDFDPTKLAHLIPA
jgi:transposase